MIRAQRALESTKEIFYPNWWYILMCIQEMHIDVYLLLSAGLGDVCSF
jgi:hypothetical protein